MVTVKKQMSYSTITAGRDVEDVNELFAPRRVTAHMVKARWPQPFNGWQPKAAANTAAFNSRIFIIPIHYYRPFSSSCPQCQARLSCAYGRALNVI